MAAMTVAVAVGGAGVGAKAAALQRVLPGMAHYDVGGFRLNLRSGVRVAPSAIELVSISADGRLIR